MTKVEKLVEENLSLLNVIEKKEKQIEYLEKKLEIEGIKFEDEDLNDLLERNN
jgi:hypothetical protein